MKVAYCEIEHGFKVPFGFGYSYSNDLKDEAVFFLFPFNHIVAVVREWYRRNLHRPNSQLHGQWARIRRERFNAGYYAGRMERLDENMRIARIVRRLLEGGR